MNRPINCLLIDDDIEEPEIFMSALRRLHLPANCTSVLSGSEAMALLEKNEIEPDIIFLDLNMSPMSGRQFLEAIKKSEFHHNIPVVIYSTTSIQTQKNEIQGLVAAGFIRKTSSLNDLKDILLSCLTSNCLN